ncbi:MAG: hypothetical protein AABY84_07695, partial [Candidatus Firestonebacteria bacterium]
NAKRFMGHHTRFCTNCYKKWKKNEANERKSLILAEALRLRESLKPGELLESENENIEIADKIIVTRNVQNKLLKRAQLSSFAYRMIRNPRLFYQYYF